MMMHFNIPYILYPARKIQHPQGLCSLAPWYNMCIPRGCSVNDSFVTVIGDQMALRRPAFVPSVLTLQSVTVMLWEVKSVCNIHPRVHTCSAFKYVLLLNNFSHLNGMHCRPVGSWMVISMDCCTCWAHCVSSSGRIISIQGRNPGTWGTFYTCYVTRSIGNRLLAAGLRSCVPLVRLPLTLWHCQGWLLRCRERIDWGVERLSLRLHGVGGHLLHLAVRFGVSAG